MSGAENNTTEKWTFGVRLIANQISRATLRTTLTYKLHPTLSAGVEYNPLAGKVSPLANWLAVSETKHRPAVILGTSSDRIGTPSGQSFYATVSKNLQEEIKLPVAPYVGVAYGTYEDRFRAIGGLNVYFTEHFSGLVIFDGVHVHQTFTYSYKRHAFSILMVRGKDPGASYSISF
ncbi:MAG TPA: hypothetical protein VNS63_09365 [Blastocatellia bacterium]|nr:hypothetical protein [Blastocatellia bacterium]